MSNEREDASLVMWNVGTLAMVVWLVLTLNATAATPSDGTPSQGTVPADSVDSAPTVFLLEDPFSATKPLKAEIAKTPRWDGPEHIRDNAFLVEEAFNQEPGVVQHIFNWLPTWSRGRDGSSRDFGLSYTMELPLGSQTHQFSFTTLVLSQFEQQPGQAAAQLGGVGDTFLNYRYQLLADDDFLWCAPRFTLIAPTGDKRFGLGNGEVGYQFNLPVSRYGDLFDFHFNAGATVTPHVSLPMDNGLLSPRHDLNLYNLGASAFWKPRTNLHFFVEAVALWNDNIDGGGQRERLTQVFVNPGVRYAICQLEDVEWVVGVASPIGLTRDTPDFSLFFYLSIEHTFRKSAKDSGS